MVEPVLERALEHHAFTGLLFPAEADVAAVTSAPIIGRLSLRASQDMARRIGAEIGLDLAGPINRAVRGPGLAALALGPDEWLLLAEADADPWLGARIGAVASGGGSVAVVDVTHRTAGLIIEGPRVADVLAAGCPLPLDTKAFPVGRATRTLLAKAEMVLWRRSPELFHLEVARSVVPYAVTFIDDVIRGERAIAAARG